jgi:peptide/nickel transport system substrate-binding protein
MNTTDQWTGFSDLMKRLLLFILIPCIPSILVMGCQGSELTAPDDSSETPESNLHDDNPITETLLPVRDILVLCASSTPESFYGTSDPVAVVVWSLITEPYAVYDSAYVASPLALTSLPSLEDGTLNRDDFGQYNVTLYPRPDLVWSDGTPLSYDQIEAGLRLPVNPFAPTFNVVASQQGDAALWVTGLNDIEYPFVPSQPPIPTHVIGPDFDPTILASDGYRTLLSTTLGPYFLAETGADNTMVFLANTHHRDAASLIPRVEIHFREASDLIDSFLDGHCDVTIDGSVPVEQLLSIQLDISTGVGRLLTWEGAGYDRLIFNSLPDPFSGRPAYFADARVRAALTAALDRTALAAIGTNSLFPAVESWIPNGHWAALSNEVVNYGLSDANSLLDAAGWSDTNGDGVRDSGGTSGAYACRLGNWSVEPGTPLSPSLLIPSGDPVREAVAAKMQADLRAIGVNLQVQVVDPSILFASDGPIVRREFDIVLVGAAGRPDPDGINRFVGQDIYFHPLDRHLVFRWELEERWLTPDQQVEIVALNNTPRPENDFRGANFSGWCREDGALLTVQAALPGPLDLRQGFYEQQQAVLATEIPELPLYSYPRVAAAASHVCGIEPVPFGPITWNLRDWYFDESGMCGG